MQESKILFVGETRPHPSKVSGGNKTGMVKAYSWRNAEDVQGNLQKSRKGQRTNAALVSIVIPCYDQAHFLDEAIESVLTQSHSHFEVIVVDDGSTDNTFEVASCYSRVRYFRQDNQGVSAARNSGL